MSTNVDEVMMQTHAPWSSISKILDKSYPKPKINMQARLGLRFVRMQPMTKKSGNKKFKLERIINECLLRLNNLKKNAIRVLV